ncbi:hypothetical protein WN55_00555 [Dufourea novaeangliae]|uniref:Odorant receptor n=1 Tax=Dufourea novaeangliae TaxID=178035 RepID=A0A154PDD2_DUFNO|nr:hypothetical protein WN55_00555 [Dufourea novaeangliae]
MLDLLMPLNVSRPRMLHSFGFLLDGSTYVDLVALHVAATCTIGVVTLVCTESTLVILVHYICGLYKIVNEFECFMSIVSTPYSIIIVAIMVCLCGHMFQVRTMFTEFEIDWEFLKDNAENIEIYREHARNVYISTLIIGICVIPILIVFQLYEYSPMILDFVLPLNESRSNELIFKAELFVVDVEEHHMSVHLFATIVLTMGLGTLVLADGTVTMFILHSCAMFKITGFADSVKEFCSTSYFIFLICGSCSITMNLYRAINLWNDKKELAEGVYFSIYQFFYLFVSNYASQMLINHSSHIFPLTYNCQWYIGPVRSQKLLLFIMHCSMKSYCFQLGGLFVPSYEGFSTVKHDSNM